MFICWKYRPTPFDQVYEVLCERARVKETENDRERERENWSVTERKRRVLCHDSNGHGNHKPWLNYRLRNFYNHLVLIALRKARNHFPLTFYTIVDYNVTKHLVITVALLIKKSRVGEYLGQLIHYIKWNKSNTYLIFGSVYKECINVFRYILEILFVIYRYKMLP